MKVAVGSLILLDDRTVDGMLRDAAGDPAKYWSTGAIADVCCHVKALAADREMLIEHIQHLQQELAITQARLENKR